MGAGRYPAAERAARGLLERHPGCGLIAKLHGIALLRQGKPSVPALQHAARLSPDDPEIRVQLGHAWQRSGELASAIASYRQALDARPDYSEALFNLGKTLQRAGRSDEAAASYRRLLELEPQLPEAHNNLGNALRDLGRTAEAVASFRQALALRPAFAVVYSNLGNALRDLGDLQGAGAAYRRALEINPDLAEPHNNLGNVLLEELRLDDAAACYRRALALRPDYAHALAGLGRVLRQQGRSAEAAASCRRALEIKPDSAETLAFLGEIQADEGRFAEAEGIFRRAIALQPDLPVALAGFSRCRRMGPDDAWWLEAALRAVAKGLPLRHEVNLQYAIGKHLDDLQDYERAFGHYRRANELTRRYGPAYDRRKLSHSIDRVIACCDERWLRRAGAGGIATERPVLIVGMPRSGTTLLEQILASHPAVHGGGELPFWNEVATAHESALLKCDPDPEIIAAAAAAYLRRLESLSAGALRVVDKTPTNYMNLGLVRAALPAARIIHLRRDPLDTCLSIYFQNFSLAHAYATDLEDLAHFYCEYLRIMRHWRSVLPAEAMLEVPYEPLIDELETWSRRILQFIGLPWDPRCLEFHETSRAVITPSRWQVRQKLSRSSVGRWRNYESFIGPLRGLLQLE